jgi:hypothetical protein
MHSATEPKRRVLSAKMPSRSFSASIAAPLRTAECRKSWEQFPDLDVESLGKLDEIEGGNISFSAFDAAIVGAVDASEAGKLLLRKTFFSRRRRICWPRRASF